MIDWITRLQQCINDHKTALAVSFGIFVQIWVSASKSIKVAMTIILYSTFMAMFITPMIIEVANIMRGSDLANGLYALTAATSVELVALIINFMPPLIREKVEKYLGLEGKYESSDQKK